MRIKAYAIATLLAALTAAGAAAAGTSGYRVLDRIAGPDGGWDYVHIDPTRNRVLVTRGTSVMAVDLASKQVAAGLAPGGRLHTAMPINGGAELVVTDGGANTAVFLDPATGAVRATVPTGKGADAAVVEPKSGLLLVMNHAGGSVTVVDPKAHKAVGTIEVGGDLEEAAVDGSGRAYVNVEDRNEIVVLDIAARKVVTRYPLKGCDGPTGLAYDAADRQLIAACDGATDIVAMASGQVVQTLPTGHGADGVAFDAKRKLAFVPAGRDGTLSVIQVARGSAKIIDTVATEKGARTLGLDARTGRIYLPSAQFAPAQGGGRPTPIAGTFHLLVVGRP
jgi:DNA-binding beta-propeller fold protein YncE